MSERVEYALRLTQILNKSPRMYVSYEWLVPFWHTMGAPEHSYPWGAFATPAYKDCACLSPDELVSWLREIGALDEGECLMLDAHLLLMATS